MSRIRAACLFLTALAATWGPARAGTPAPVDVLPVRVGEGAVPLHGTWKFQYVPSVSAGADGEFFLPARDVSAWPDIMVPGHWELQGFAEPQYGSEVKPGTGLYRRTFTTPAVGTANA